METTAATALTGLLIGASLTNLSYVGRVVNRAGAANQAAQAAQVLLYEICEKAYTEPSASTTTLGLDANESALSRSTLDDVDDYHAFSFAALTDRDGYYLPGLLGWTGNVTVRYVSVASPETTSTSDTGLKRIDLTLCSPTGQSYSFSSLRTASGPLYKPVFGTGKQVQTTAEFTGQYRGTVWRSAARLNNQQIAGDGGTTP